jgi:hypothetical protein
VLSLAIVVVDSAAIWSVDRESMIEAMGHPGDRYNKQHRPNQDRHRPVFEQPSAYGLGAGRHLRKSL